MCYNRYNMAKTTSNCLVCQTPFQHKPCRSPKYCSRKCYNARPQEIRKRRGLLARFWGNVHKTANCWFWLGTTVNPTLNGYGTLTIERIGNKNRSILAHRLSWQIHFGPIPDGHCVMHICDMPQCVRPDHLKLGTMAENSRDSFSKGRNGPALRNRPTHAKLTAESVVAIRTAHGNGCPQIDLARKYGVSKQLINLVIKRISWPHIE
jgi:hypothetical protein